jgi:aminopeptidase N
MHALHSLIEAFMKDATVTPAAKPTLLKDYTPFSHLLTCTELSFEIVSEQEVRVSSRLHFSPNPDAKDTTRLELDGGKDIALHALRIDGTALSDADYTREGERLSITRIPGSDFVLEADVIINPEANTTLAGLYTSGGKFCTQCESHGFRNITFFPDRPDVLSEYFTTIIADGSKYPQMLANGNKVADETLADGRRRVQWHDPFLKPSYLFALVAADLALLEDSFTTASDRNVRLEMYTDKPKSGKLEDATAQLTHAMDSLKRSMKWDEERFGREYDLDLFMVVAVDDFNFGAMENKGLNIFNSKALLATPDTATDARYGRVESVVAHEYFHNWTGNRITCRDWFQLCLKEGLTVFRDQQFSADTHSHTMQRIADARFLRSTQFAEDAGPNAHPIRPDSFMTVENFYTTTIYEKGSEVIGMLHTILGRDGFRKGTDLYFERHDGQAVTTEDFVAAMADANSIDLTQFEQSWYTQAGTPTLAVREEYDAKNARYTLHFTQSCPPVQREREAGLQKIAYVIPVKIGLIGADGTDLPLAVEDGTTLLHGDTFLLTTNSYSLTFTNVKEKPVASLLRHFSAPVKLDFATSRTDLAFRIAHDSDGFNRWEAAQQLAVSVLQELIAAHRASAPLVVDAGLIDAYRAVLQNTALERDMVAEMLSLPGYDYLAGLYPNGSVVPESITAARIALRAALADALEEELAEAYAATTPEVGTPYRFTRKDVADRALRNSALFYLMAGQHAARYAPLAEEQQETATNFTDEMGALSALTTHRDGFGSFPIRQQAMDRFFRKWKHDALVIDSWLSTEAMINRPDALERTAKLMQSEWVRDEKNPEKLKPNRVRAVLGSFATANPVQFHRPDGKGYHFLADQVLVLDKANPRLAAGMVKPLCDWERYEPARQEQMLVELKRVAAHPTLSTDTKEIVGNALKNAS